METNLVKLYLLVLILQIITVRLECFKFLILHPVYSGSHVLTVHKISHELIKRGHDVLTIRYKDTHDLKLTTSIPENQTYSDDEENSSRYSSNVAGRFREYEMSLNNSNGDIPFLTVEEDAKFEIPFELLWSEGTKISTLFKLPGNPWDVLKGF